MVSSPEWQPAWQAVQPYVGFVRELAAQYRATRLNVGAEDADDLCQEFIITRLPRIVERLADLPQQERDGYLVVAFRNFVRTHLRSAARYRRAVEAFAQEQEPAVEQQGASWGEHRIPSDLEPILREFFSEGGSVRSVAERFGLTRHAARRAVVDGSLSLALRLGDADALSKRERDVCRQILLEGSSIAETARELRLTETQVRSALASARARMVAQLK